MAHPAARRRCNPSDKADDRLLDVLLNEFCGLLFCIATDLADHDDCLCLGVLFKQQQHIDETGPIDWIAADAHAGCFAQSEGRKLMHGLVGKGPATGNDTHHTLLMDKSRHDADLSLVHRDDTWAIRTD